MAVLAAMLVVALLGCGPIGWAAHSVAGGKKRVQVPAQYQGLEHQRIAVLVAVDEYTLHQHRQSPLLICQAVSSEIAEHVPGAKLVNPRDVVAFQHDNPYWSTARYSELIDKLEVDRLVVVDLLDYRLHEPGNMHVWQGVVTGTVMIAEAEARDPDRPVMGTTVRAEFPEEAKVGTVNSNADAIQLGMVQRFGESTGRLFHDHEVWQ